MVCPTRECPFESLSCAGRSRKTCARKLSALEHDPVRSIATTASKGKWWHCMTVSLKHMPRGKTVSTVATRRKMFTPASTGKWCPGAT
eukprot:1207165-Amphidinium_carterae.2